MYTGHMHRFMHQHCFPVGGRKWQEMEESEYF